MVSDFTVPSRPSWPGIIQLFHARESLVTHIPAEDGKIANLFDSVSTYNRILYHWRVRHLRKKYYWFCMTFYREKCDPWAKLTVRRAWSNCARALRWDISNVCIYIVYLFKICWVSVIDKSNLLSGLRRTVFSWGIVFGFESRKDKMVLKKQQLMMSIFEDLDILYVAKGFFWRLDVKNKDLGKNLQHFIVNNFTNVGSYKLFLHPVPRFGLQ
jgi:hypothetical protein